MINRNKEKQAKQIIKQLRSNINPPDIVTLTTQAEVIMDHHREGANEMKNGIEKIIRLKEILHTYDSIINSVDSVIKELRKIK